MGVLTVEQIAAARAEWMRNWPRNEPAPLNKPDLLAAFVALDAWLDANAAAANLAIPQPARSALTAKQKARLLKAVISARYEVA